MKRLWFKDKEYGWGWRPYTWEGWAVTLFFIALVAVRSASLSLSATIGSAEVLAYSIDILGLVVFLAIIAFFTGEKPHWRWGGKKVNPSFAIAQSLILLGFLFVTFMVGFFGAGVTVVDGWYYGLAKPDLTPPPWVFAPVWSVLYLLMGLAAYFAWYHVKAHRIAILLLYAFNLILNALWSYAFFALHDLGLSVFLIALLDIVVLSLTFRFLKWWPPSGNLMMPYLAWILFATYLNVNLFLLN